MWLGEPRSTNPLRIPHPPIDKLACQAQGVGILAKGEITLRNATAHTYFALLFYHTCGGLSRAFKNKMHSFLLVNLTTSF